MADLIQERHFPSLLDRLTDDQPHKTVEPRVHRVFSIRRLRAAVLRDLEWLLNTSHLAVTEDLADFPLAAKSVINYGIPDLTGKTVSGLGLVDLEREVRQCILTFEPRILPNTLEVRGQKSEDHANALTFEIEGELWSEPIPERLFLRTELDLETGTVTIEDA